MRLQIKWKCITKINFLFRFWIFYVSQFCSYSRNCYLYFSLNRAVFFYLYKRNFWLCLTCNYVLWKNLLCKNELIHVCIMSRTSLTWTMHVEKCNKLFFISVWWWTMLLRNQRPSLRPQKVRVVLAVVALFMLLSKCWHGAE